MKTKHFLCCIPIVCGCILFPACQKDMTDMGTVDSPVLSLTEDTVTLHPGETHKLQLTYGISRIEWTSEHDTVATVDFRGVVTALSVGTTTVTASRSYEKDSLPNRVDSCFIQVIE